MSTMERRRSIRIIALEEKKKEEKERKMALILDRRSNSHNKGKGIIINEGNDMNSSDDSDDDERSVLFKEVQPVHIGSSSRTNVTSTMPEKQILQSLLDVLQREDLDELFAQPANLNMVENHSPIIKQPMDFGTMRAKLHEDLYQTFEQFKLDMFLMCSNAMNTNPANSSQYKVAKTMSVRAKRLFEDLNAEENDEWEIFPNKRRSIRRSRGGQPRTPRNASVSKPIVTERNNNAAVSQEDNRDTYSPPTLSSNSSLFKEYLEANKSKINLIQDPSNYKESLQMFVEDLGPIAKKVAAKKLEPLSFQQQKNVDNNYHDAPPGFNTPLMNPPAPLPRPRPNNITVINTNASRDVGINVNNNRPVNIENKWNERAAAILAEIFVKKDKQPESDNNKGKFGNVFPLLTRPFQEGISQNNVSTIVRPTIVIPNAKHESNSMASGIRPTIVRPTFVRPTIVIPNAKNESNSRARGSSDTSKPSLFASPRPWQQSFFGPRVSNWSIPRSNNLIRPHATHFSNVPNPIRPMSFQAMLMGSPNMDFYHLLGPSTSSPQGFANNMGIQQNYQIAPIQVPPKQEAGVSCSLSIGGLNYNEEGVGGVSVDQPEEATTLHLLWDNDPYTKLSL
ncbi:Bromodomain-containing protein [Arachis hypogaea]|nr:Bromodomain-containing protein [Arachis hypogaea]